MTVPTDVLQSADDERTQASPMATETSNSYRTSPGGEKDVQKEKEERIRLFKEQQEEERLKRLKELEQQFIQAKKHREQQEEERRRRIEEARLKETERRQLVEERKRQIWEAEQERKEAILRRNMEREARIEARRNAQRMSQSFAFGSSTPRTFDLDLAAIGIKNPGSVLMSSVSGRRSEERELGPPRATSACSLDRKFGDDLMSRSMVSLSSSAYRGRKRTDITPTLTRERSMTPHMTPRGKDTSRSPSRPQSSMSGASEISATSSSISAVNMRTRSAPRRPRPFSVAGSIVDRSAPLATTNVVKKEVEHHPRVSEKPAPNAVSKQPRAKSVGREKSVECSRPMHPTSKPVPPPKSVEVLARAKAHPVPSKDNLRKPHKPNMSTVLKSKSQEVVRQTSPLKETAQSREPPQPEKADLVNPSPLISLVADSDVCISSEINTVTESDINVCADDSEPPKPNMSTVLSAKSQEVVKQIPSLKETAQDKEPSLAAQPEKSDPMNPSPLISPVTDSDICISSEISAVTESDINTFTQSCTESELKRLDSESANAPAAELSDKVENIPITPEQSVPAQEAALPSESEIVKEVPSKPRITSEEEAKAALAEKRRLAREQAEREAELERLRLEEIRRQEEERRRLEELEMKRLEEEQLRLAELHRQLEEEKLRKAIEEQQQREREEQQRREEEARLKAEKEEQEKKAREEAERQRIELEERLKKEEKERAERKKRVEEIMARTRARAAANASASTNSIKTPTAEETNPAATPTVLDVNKSSLQNGSAAETTVTTSASISHLSNLENTSSPLPDLLNSDSIANHSAKNNGYIINSSEHLSSVKPSNGFISTSNRTVSANDIASPTQTNGYSSHDDMSCTTSPEDQSDMGLLVNLESSPQKETSNSTASVDFPRLVSVEPTPFNLNNDNYLINVDSMNSNIISSDSSYTGFDDCLQKKKDTPVDLLS